MGTKGAKVKREEQKANTEKEGAKTRGVRTGGKGDWRKRRRGDDMNELKLIYNNIGGQSRKIWTEDTEMIQKEKFDILALTETHWREEQNGQHLQGYRRYRMDRGGDAKQEGVLRNLYDRVDKPMGRKDQSRVEPSGKREYMDNFGRCG